MRLLLVVLDRSAPAASAWLIEVFRYPVNSAAAAPLPTWSARPGIQIIR